MSAGDTRISVEGRTSKPDLCERLLDRAPQLFGRKRLGKDGLGAQVGRQTAVSIASAENERSSLANQSSREVE